MSPNIVEMMTIIPADADTPVESYDTSDFEIIEQFADGTILVEVLATGQQVHLRKLMVH